MPDARAPRRGSPVVLAAALAIVLGGSLAASTFSGVFGARTLRVEGARALEDQVILDRAGLAAGVNVFHLDTARVEAALSEDPWIASAEVVRDLPSTVIVRVVERTPIGIVGGQAIAGDGVMLPNADLAGLPRIEHAGGPLDAGSAASAASAISSLAAASRRMVEGVMISASGDLVLDLGAMQVRWGAPGQDDAKAASLEAVLRSVREDGRSATMIDLSVPAAPAVTFAA